MNTYKQVKTFTVVGQYNVVTVIKDVESKQSNFNYCYFVQTEGNLPLRIKDELMFLYDLPAMSKIYVLALEDEIGKFEE